MLSSTIGRDRSSAVYRRVSQLLESDALHSIVMMGRSTVSKLNKAASFFTVAFAVVSSLLFALVRLDDAKTRHDLEKILVEVEAK